MNVIHKQSMTAFFYFIFFQGTLTKLIQRIMTKPREQPFVFDTSAKFNLSFNAALLGVTF